MKKFVFIIILLLLITISAFSQTSKFVVANGIKTHYLEWGKGKRTIVLIHGLSDTADIWKDFASILAEDFRVIAPNRRGIGLSEKPSANYDAENLAVDIEKFLDALKIEKAIVIGHSFGGNIALTLAAKSPDKINSLILIEGGFWEKREPAPLSECAVPVEVDCLIENLIKRGINEYDAENLYPKVSVPTLLILGLPTELNKSELNDEEKTNKKFFDEAIRHTNEVAKKKLKNAKSLVIKNARHWVFADQPKTVAGEIKKFVKAN